jgi:hypothetical protein
MTGLAGGWTGPVQSVLTVLSILNNRYSTFTGNGMALLEVTEFRDDDDHMFLTRSHQPPSFGYIWTFHSNLLPDIAGTYIP